MVMHAIQHLRRPGVKRPQEPIRMTTNAQKELDCLIAAIMTIRNAQHKGDVQLRENADCAIIALDIMRDVATAVDALGVSLAYHVGVDRVNPCFVAALDGSDYECVLEEAANERDEPPIDLRDAFGTLNKAQQGI